MNVRVGGDEAQKKGPEAYDPFTRHSCPRGGSMEFFKIHIYQYAFFPIGVCPDKSASKKGVMPRKGQNRPKKRDFGQFFAVFVRFQRHSQRHSLESF